MINTQTVAEQAHDKNVHIIEANDTWAVYWAPYPCNAEEIRKHRDEIRRYPCDSEQQAFELAKVLA